MSKYDPKQSFLELIAAIQKEADNCCGNTALPLVPFATLLVKLSGEADIQTRRIIRLTVGLFWLTFALLAATLTLMWIAHSTDERIKLLHEIAEQQKELKTHEPPNPQAAGVSK